MCVEGGNGWREVFVEMEDVGVSQDKEYSCGNFGEEVDRREGKRLGKDRYLQERRGGDDRQKGGGDGMRMVGFNFFGKVGGQVIC